MIMRSYTKRTYALFDEFLTIVKAKQAGILLVQISNIAYNLESKSIEYVV